MEMDRIIFDGEPFIKWKKLTLLSVDYRCQSVTAETWRN